MPDKSQWGTISIEMPDWLRDISGSVNTIAEIVTASLDVAVAALQVLKAFSVGYLDILATAVQEIIDAINGLVLDFGEIGLYITGDYGLIDQYPFEDIKGGFQGYERRMIARLTDRTDPTRPDISTDTTTFSFFGYLSVPDYVTEGNQSIDRLKQFFSQITAMFSVQTAGVNSQPVPVIDRIDYGTSITGVFQGFVDGLGYFGENPPNKAKVVWRTPQPTTKKASQPLSNFRGPGGYLVTVSTLPNGIPLKFDRPQADVGRQRTEAGEQQPREYGDCVDFNGRPLMLYGGAEELEIPSTLSWNANTESGKAKDGTTRVYGIDSPAKNNIIPLDLLQEGSTYYFQRTFRLGLNQVALNWATQEFSLILNKEDLPEHAEITAEDDGTMSIKGLGRPSTYYVRVASTSREIGSGDQDFGWDFSKVEENVAKTAGEPFLVPRIGGQSPTAVGEWSQPQKITYPTGNTSEYLKAIQTALVVLALSRSDLTVIDDLQGSLSNPDVIDQAKSHKLMLRNIVLQRTGLEPYAHLLDRILTPNFKKVIEKPQEDPKNFRRTLLRQTARLARELRDSTGFDEGMEEFVVQNSQNLRGAYWEDILEQSIELAMAGNYRLTVSQERAGTTLLKALEQKTADAGVAPNAYTTGLTADSIDALFRIDGLVRQRKPHFIEVDPSNLAVKAPFQASISAAEADFAIADASPMLSAMYEKYRQLDGSIQVPSDVAEGAADIAGQGRTVGSADYAPVFYVGREILSKFVNKGQDVIDSTQGYDPEQDQNKGAGFAFCRTLLGKYENGVLFREAAQVLSLAASVYSRPVEDGEWVALRFFDGFPGMEGFLDGVQNWLVSLASATQSSTDAISAYISFLEGRIAEIQQMIRRLNGLIQSILGLTFSLPAFSGLCLASNGTRGVLSDLVSAENKPVDNPIDYGAGIAVVMPLLSGSAGQFVQNLIVCAMGEKPDPEGSATITEGEDPFGVDSIPETPAPVGPGQEPDVL